MQFWQVLILLRVEVICSIIQGTCILESVIFFVYAKQTSGQVSCCVYNQRHILACVIFIVMHFTEKKLQNSCKQTRSLLMSFEFATGLIC